MQIHYNKSILQSLMVSLISHVINIKVFEYDLYVEKMISSLCDVEREDGEKAPPISLTFPSSQLSFYSKSSLLGSGNKLALCLFL